VTGPRPPSGDAGPHLQAGDAVAARVAADRERTLGRIAGLERDLRRLHEATADSPDDEHDPEGATIGFERAQVTSLLAAARAHLTELDAAAERRRTGDTGTCGRCGGPIGEERLDARPTTELCVRCAE
jgi:DnaK suppressor protein